MGGIYECLILCLYHHHVMFDDIRKRVNLPFQTRKCLIRIDELLSAFFGRCLKMLAASSSGRMSSSSSYYYYF
jgi:hypothetical protein